MKTSTRYEAGQIHVSLDLDDYPAAAPNNREAVVFPREKSAALGAIIAGPINPGGVWDRHCGSKS